MIPCEDGIDAELRTQHDECPPQIDWDSLIPCQTTDDQFESSFPLVDEDGLFALMGLRDDVDGGSPVVDGVSSTSGSDGFDDGPETSPVNDNIPGETSVQYDKEDPPMTEGFIYGTMEEFRMALRTHAIKGQFVVLTEKSESNRFRGYCQAKDGGCPWAIVVRAMPDGKSVKVTMNKFEHSCTSTGRIQTPMASKYWIAEKAINFLKEHPNMGPGELRKCLERKYNVPLAYSNVYKGRELAVQQLFGSWEESFEMLHRFKAEVDLRNPGSIVEIDVQQVGEETYFYRFSCCFKASIDGFLNGCRPYLSIDSTALNGRWNGHLAAATGLDGHNWMYPVAFAFFDAETTDNWSWFMRMLKKAIGEPENLAISSDACKGLENAVRSVYPWAEHRECFRHLMDNFIKKFQGPVYGNMYPVARSYLPSRFEYYMAKIYSANSNVKPWLDRYHNMLWMRSRFSEAIKCDYVTNNLAESWNAWVKEGRPQETYATTSKRQKVAQNATTSSPGPVTRRRLAMGIASGEGEGGTSQQHSPGPVTRRRLAMGIASGEGEGGNNQHHSTSPRPTKAQTAKKLTPKKSHKGKEPAKNKTPKKKKTPTKKPTKPM